MELIRLLVAACCAAILALLPARGDVAAEQEGRYRRLPPGREISPQRGLEGMALALGKTNPAGYAEQVEVLDHPEFDRAMRLLTRRVPDHPSGFQTSARTVAEVKRGELLLAVFWARAAGASESAEGAFVFEPVESTDGRSVSYRFECEREWRRIFVPFLAASDSPAGEAVLRFYAGYGPQVLEIGGLRLVSYGTTLSFAELPFTPLAYRGRNPESPWREQAAASIEKQRKAPLIITVRNSRGRVVPWAQVRIHQLAHAYDFGVALRPPILLEDSEDGEAYRAHVLEEFNSAEINAGLDWGAAPSERQLALDAAEWLRDYELGTRSHALFGADGQLPPDLASLREKRADLRARVLEHVREKVGAAKGIIPEWTVPIALAAEGELGIGLLAEVLRAAREADAKARLLVHAGNVLADGVGAAQQTAVVQAIRSLVQAKAPVQGIVLGSHFGEQLVGPDRVWEALDRFAELRLPLSVADFEVDTWDEGAQADYTRDFATVVFAHPATTGFSLAAFWAKGHPLPNAALYATDWTPRAAARMWQELMDKRWSSTGTVTANSKGIVKTKAFLGHYAIEVRGGSKSNFHYTTVGKNGRWTQISMPSASSK